VTQPLSLLPPQARQAKFGRLKRVVRYLFAGHQALEAASRRILRAQTSDLSSEELLDDICREVGFSRGPRLHEIFQLMVTKGPKGCVVAGGSRDLTAGSL
jgi:hypothetical protein